MSKYARALVALIVVVLAAGLPTSAALADGDPGSDVLVFQDLFAPPDAGISVGQQVQLGDLLHATNRMGVTIRVAVIASRSDLGAITALWREPRLYARFLGMELSLAYKQRLLVVMPNGFGFNWPGHSTASAYRLLAKIPIKGGAGGLFAAAEEAVRALASAGGAKIPPAAHASSSALAPAGAASSGAGAGAVGRRTDSTVAIVVVAFAALAAVVVAFWFALGRGREGRVALPGRFSSAPRRALSVRVAVPSLALVLAIAVATPIIVLSVVGKSRASPQQELASNPYLDPGTTVSRPAPGFTLDDQFGQPVPLASFRGKVVLLAFNDSECTTVCPLTTTAMLDAKAMLGRAGAEVQLMGVDADPAATSLEDVLSYSQLHGMLHQWHFLTGSLSQLRRVWGAYGVEAAVEHGEITHTPALYIIDPRGREAKVYLTQQSYAAVGQFGKVLALEASSLLPGHPPVHSDLSYAPIPGITPSSGIELPTTGGQTIRLGPGRSARLFVFFATWDQEITSLGGQLDALNRYAASAAASRLPSLTAVDEGSVEPSRRALSSFLGGLPQPLAYPVAIDQSGRLADGYGVQGQPWFVLTSPAGQILWYWEVSTSGWLSTNALVRYVRAALARAPVPPAGAAAVTQALAGSPRPLAALHEQAGRLLGGQPALAARIHTLQGYPLVINAWASWCGPCRSEFALFASASARYGRHVGFLGVDTDDSPGDARSFLAQHPVSYPSYQASITDLSSLAAIEGLPTTIFINPAGKVVFVHIGQYDSQGTLDQDIESYAPGA